MNKVVVLHLLSALLSLCLAWVSWRRRHVRAAAQLGRLMVGIGWWSGFEAAITLVSGVAAKVLWVKVQYIGMALVTPLFLEFAIAYSDEDGWFIRLVRAVAWAVCAGTVGMVWTNPLHSLHWRSVVLDASNRLLVFERGPWFWVFIASAYVALLTGTGALTLLVVRTGARLRSQPLVILLASLLPWLGNMLYNSHLFYVPGLDWTPILFSLTGLLVVFATFRLGFLALLPVARSAVVDTMSDGVLVLDDSGRLVDLNPAAARLAAIDSVHATPAPSVPPVVASVVARGEEQAEVTLQVAGRDRTIEVRVSPFGASKGRPLGRLVILRDITERRAAERERERLLAELQSAVAEISTLRGLLPICSSCKRVRDDSGYWNQIESYISAHADVRFSHGLCPDCAHRLYPEVFGKPDGQQS